MDATTQFQQLEKAFYSDGYQLGMRALASGGEKQHLFAALNEMYAGIDGLIQSVEQLARQQQQAIACKRGCHWCCHQPVFALDYELELLAAFIEANFSEQEKNEIKQKAREKQTVLANKTGDDLLNSKHPCPLLKDGACSAYLARPMACRIYLSTDVETCLHFYNKPDDPSRYPALVELPMRLGRMLNEGFKSALKTNGKVAKEFRIEEWISTHDMEIDLL